MCPLPFIVSPFFFFFFNDTATTEIYTLSLHDALPIFNGRLRERLQLRFDARLGILRKLAAVGTDDLHPVVAPRVVARRNDRGWGTCARGVEGDRGRRQDPEEEGRHALSGQPPRQFR